MISDKAKNHTITLATKCSQKKKYWTSGDPKSKCTELLQAPTSNIKLVSAQVSVGVLTYWHKKRGTGSSFGFFERRSNSSWYFKGERTRQGP